MVAASGTDGDDGSVLPSKNVVAINVPPLMAFGRAPQVTGSIIHLFAAIPVLLMYAGTGFPLVVLVISAVVMAILVRMVLRERWQASEGSSQHRESEHLYHSIHSYSSLLRFL
jgi:type III secretory pathway component EscV